MSDLNTNEKNECAGNVTNPVVFHYNNKKETGLDDRAKSPIYNLRNFNNWIKSVLLKEYVYKLNTEKRNKSLSVIDLGCGRGGDIKKWMNSRNVDYVLFTDIAEISLKECEHRYKEFKSRFNADFLHIDLSTEFISEKYSKINEHKELFDLISCQFVIHYSFETYHKAMNFIKNVSDSLNPGGYFIGTTTDSFEIVKRLRESGTNTFGNDIYNVKYLNEEDFSNQPPLFGAKINFSLTGVVDCPEYLLYFPALVKIAFKYNLRLVFKKRFSDFYNEYCENRNYKYLLEKMDVFEKYDENNFTNKKLSDYEHVCEKLKEYKNNNNNETSNVGETIELATLSKSEWEAATLYICFGFQKF